MKFIICVCLLAIVQAVNSQGYVNPLKKKLNKHSKTSNPAVKVQLTAKGLNYAASIAAGLMVKEVTKTKIDDISGKNVVKWSVRNIKIDSFKKPDPDISMIPGHGLKLKFKNAALSASARWKYRKHFVKDSGKVRVTARSISLSLSINIIADSAGRPKFNAHSCDVNLGGFKVKMRGGASFLYNPLLKAFNGKVKKTVKKSICKAALNSINNNGNKQLATLNLQSGIGEGLILDYFLTGSPTFTGTYLETSHKGTFLGDTDIPKIPLIGSPSNTMIGFSIAAEAFNSAARIIFKKNLLNKEFDIDAVKNLLVKIDPKFSNAKLFAKINPSSAPRITITLDVLSANLQVQAELIGQMPDGSKISVMTVDINVEASTKVEIKDEKIVLQLTQLIPKANVKVTHIGQVPTVFLNDMLAEIIRMAMPQINLKLQKGFPLPNVDKIKFPQASIKLLPGYISIASNIVYNP